MTNTPKQFDKPLPPGSFGLPFLGERPQLLDNEYLMQQYEKHGPIFKTRVLGRNVAVFMGAEANRFLLATGMKHFSWRDGWPPTFKELLGRIVICARWRRTQNQASIDYACLSS
jgi:hypothetical protein